MVCARSMRQVLRHDQHHAVAADRRRHRQRDAGVARGGLDQRVAGPDLAALLGAADHADRRPVLHRAGRVVALELAQDHVAACRSGVARQALQAHQRRAADGVFEGLVRGHGVIVQRLAGAERRARVIIRAASRRQATHHLGPGGEIGRRSGLKIPRRKACRFESGPGHQTDLPRLPPARGLPTGRGHHRTIAPRCPPCSDHEGPAAHLHRLLRLAGTAAAGLEIALALWPLASGLFMPWQVLSYACAARRPDAHPAEHARAVDVRLRPREPLGSEALPRLRGRQHAGRGHRPAGMDRGDRLAVAHRGLLGRAPTACCWASA